MESRFYLNPKLEIWDKASPEMRKLGKEVFLRALDLGVRYFDGAPLPSPPGTPSDLDDALAKADKLDAKLVGEILQRKEAALLASAVFERAIEIALKAIIVGLM